MQLTDIGQLIASRTLILKENASTREVTITIGKPQKFSDGEDSYYCPFQITGMGDGKVSWAGGIDAVQALLLALEQIGFVLAESEEYKQGKISWIGSDKSNLGFPHMDSSGILRDIGINVKGVEE